MGGFQPNDPRDRRIRLTQGRAAVEVAPGIGGRLSALEIDGWDLLRRDGWTDREWGAFVMAPWVGRLRDAHVDWDGRAWEVTPTAPPHALHGTVMDTPWLLSDVSSRTVRMETSLGPAWPTGGRLVHTIALDDDRLRLRLEVHAERDATPVILGWHPWFHRRATRVVPLGRAAIVRDSIDETLRMTDVPRLLETGEVEVLVDARRRVALDADGLPTGALLEPRGDPRDDVLLGVTRPPVVRYPGGPTLHLVAGGAAAWVVYTAHPDGVCVEPVTGLPDGINGGLLGEPPVARPLNPVVATLEIVWG
jgi:galactose mutarotase-like enzyme